VRAIGIYRRMTWLRLKRGWLKWAAVGVLALPVVVTGALAASGKWGLDLFNNMLELYLRFLVLFVPALATSQVVSEEIDSRTFTFLFVRPAPRWALPLGKYLATMVPLVLLFALSLTLTFVIALLVPPAGPAELVQNLPVLFRALAAVSLGVLAFGAICALLGTWFTRHPFVAVIAYLLIVEVLIASLSLIINLLAVSWHLRNLAGVATVTSSDFVFAEVHVAPWISALVVAGVTLLALLGAAASVSGAEYRTDR
jgi:ABC-type transport system involved in multi-copper enzyme maturation permease subunit